MRLADLVLGGFGGLVAKDWKQRTRSTEEMYGEVFGIVSQIPGLRVVPRLDPPLPTPGQYDVELVLQSDAPPERLIATVGQVVGAGWQSGKFLYVATDLKHLSRLEAMSAMSSPGHGERLAPGGGHENVARGQSEAAAPG